MKKSRSKVFLLWMRYAIFKEILTMENFDQSEEMKRRLLTIREAAKRSRVSRQAIYVAIKQKKLKAKKDAKQWMITMQDLADYHRNKYSRKKSMYNGELIFDKDKGFYSVKEAAEMLDVPVQKIYYAARVGLLRAFRKGAAWVIQLSEIERYRDGYLQQEQNAESATSPCFAEKRAS